MNRKRFLAAILGSVALFAPRLSAQETPKPESKIPASTLKIQVIFAESQGEKKLTSLPYTFFVEAGQDGHSSPWTKLRMGSRVPVYGGKDGGMQYLDVGTNIDSRGFTTESGKFDVVLNLERSWVEGDVTVPVGNRGAGSVPKSGQFYQPSIRQFKTELTLTMKDGQTIQTTQAPDPLSAKVWTITVTMNVVK